MLEHLAKSVTDFIREFCNIKTIPAELKHPAIEMICGDFLYFKKLSGGLVGADGEPLYESDRGETSVKVGNITVNFESSNSYTGLSDEAQFDNEIAEMRDRRRWKKLLMKYRKIKWEPF